MTCSTRRAWWFAAWALAFAAACGGGDDDGSDMGTDPCDGRPDGLSCGTGMICVDEACVAPSCGDGVTTGSEACDDGNDVPCDGCAADCSREDDDCGDGVMECGEECEPPDTVSCNASCETIVAPAVCGNLAIEAGEQCDPPEIPVTSQQCSSMCQLVADACTACEATICSNFEPFGSVNLVAACYAQAGNAAAGPAAGEPLRVLCAELVRCMLTSGCADAFAPVSDCLCGTGIDPTPTACGAQAGPCAAEARAAFETTALSELLERYVDPSYAGGDATRLVQCDQFLCSSDCGI